MPTIADYLKHANLQMAAEAFLADKNGNLVGDIQKALIKGNEHASFFTDYEATKFNAEWQVIAQRPDTTTGFSGTLFQNKETGELVLSMRSTEFIDDAVRDSMATNTKEIFNTGWAWGQIADMEDWYGKLKVDGVSLSQRQFTVTGYSLGGHLATAFNLLHQNDIAVNGGKVVQNVVTFNGAGVGKVKTGSLSDALAYFNSLRGENEQNQVNLKAALNLTNTDIKQFYDDARTNLKAGTWTAIYALTILNGIQAAPGASVAEEQTLNREKAPLLKALNDIIDLQTEALRIQNFTNQRGQRHLLSELMSH